jgi:hypothetical protein
VTAISFGKVSLLRSRLQSMSGAWGSVTLSDVSELENIPSRFISDILVRVCRDVRYIISFPSGSTAPGGPRSPHFRGFMITNRHTTLGRTPLDGCSARRRDLYLTTHNTHKRQTSMPPTGFEPKIPASDRPQPDALDRAATGIG